jgi:hypothetical protein
MIMKVKNSYWFILLIIVFSCDGISHDRTTFILNGFQDQQEIIYETMNTSIYIGYEDLIEYFNNKGLCERCSYNFFPFIHDSTYYQFINYSKLFGENPIIISDALATKIISIEGNLTRVKDENHIYYELSEDMSLILIEFASLGKLKIFDRYSNIFVKKIVIDEVDTKTETPACPEFTDLNITLTNESIILSIPFGCKS